MFEVYNLLLGYIEGGNKDLYREKLCNESEVCREDVVDVILDMIERWRVDIDFIKTMER